MDLSALVTQLQGVGSLGQVVQAQTGGYQTPVDSAAEIYSQLGSLVSNRVHPVTLKDTGAHPSIVYQLVSSSVGAVEGYRITQTDEYVLMVRHTSFDSLFTLVGSINTQLAASAFAIDIDDLLFDYDEQISEPDAPIYRANIKVSFTYLSAGAQTFPAAFVYSVGRSAEPSTYDNLVKQRVENQYAIVLVTQSGNLQTLMDDVQAQLLGFQRTAFIDPFEYVGGRNIEGVAGLEMWREVYRDVEHIQES